MQEGFSKEALRAAVGRLVDQKVFAYCLGELVKKGEVIQEGALVRFASHQVALQADEELLQKELLAWYKDRGLATATLKETEENFSDYPAKVLKEVLALLLREERLIKVSESLYYDSTVIADLTEKVVSFMKKEGEIDAPRFKEMTGLTRKFSIPILEYFDRTKLTFRVEDKRILRKK